MPEPTEPEITIHATVCSIDLPFSRPLEKRAASVAPDSTLDPFDFLKYSPDQPRDDRGRFDSVSGTIASRTRDSGGSTTTVHGRAITTGKSVSPYPEHSRPYRNEHVHQPAFIAKAVEKYRTDKADLLSQPGHALGTWLDTDTGTLWLDVVVVVSTRREAASLARRHNQIAYFDLDTGQEVRTGGTGLSKRLRDGAGRLHGWLVPGGGVEAAREDDGMGTGGQHRGDRSGNSDRSVTADPFDLGLSLTGAGSLGIAKQFVRQAVHEQEQEQKQRQQSPLPNLSPRGEVILGILVKRFNPSQPRDEYGRWTDGGASSVVGERIAPHYQQPFETATGRGGAPANPNATRMSAMTPEFLADMERRFNEVGIDDIPDDLVANLDTLMKRIKAEHPSLIDLGKEWYAAAQDRIASHALETGTPLDAAIGMTAAMSPNSEWGQNIALAGEMMRQLKADAPITVTKDDLDWLKTKAKTPKGQNYASFLKRVKAGETPRPSELSDIEAAVGVQLVGRRRQLVSENPTLKGTYGKVAFATGTRNMAKAIAIYRGAEVDGVLGGHKVRSFYNNLSDPYDSRGVGDVTIDTHAASAAQLFRMPMAAKRADLTVWGGASTGSNQMGAYPVYADAFREVASRHGMTANQAQAVLWVGWQQVRHEYPGIVVSEDAKTLASGLKQADVYGPARQSTIGRYGIQTGESGVLNPPRYKSQVSAWQQYRDGVIDHAQYMQILGTTPS